jgi:hypothetical protein
MGAMRFNDLSMHDKQVLVDDFSTELCSIEFYDHRVHLYSLDAILIEAYHNIDSGEIERITVANYGDLDKFLTRIRIQPLYQRAKKNS